LARIHLHVLTVLSFKKGAAVDLPGNLLFREVQRFRETWLWPVLLIPAVLASLYVIFVMVETLFLDEEKGTLAGDAAALALSFYILKGFGALIALLYALRLEIEVRSAGLFVRFAPFQRKFRHVPAADLRSAEVRDARWQWRPGWRVYGLKGTQAVELITPNGHRFLIATTHPSQLAEALAAAAV
jgi:hypothetical protein